MSKEKQIEEMALELCRPRNIVKMIHHRTCGNCDTRSCDIYELCVDLYNAGYRKQSEGEWKLHGNDDDLGSSYWCSNCFYQVDEDIFYPHGYDEEKPYKYCPNCGAKMRKENEGK